MPTEFARWLERTKLSRAQAAEKLGKSRATIEAYAVGRLRGARRSRVVGPDYATRVLMRLIAQPGLLNRPVDEIKPWPSDQEGGGNG